MTYLSEVVTVEHRNVRSVNVELELESSSPLAGFVATEQVQDVVRRILSSTGAGERARAWSITGPYGAGKSSIAHFVCALFARSTDAAHADAMAVLGHASVDLAAQVETARATIGLGDRGAIRAVVTAEREPITGAVARALHRGAETFWVGRGRRPELAHELHAIAARVRRGEFPDPGTVVDSLDRLLAVAPVFLVLDELGKALEYAADRSRESDLYLLQQIAERFSSSQKPEGGLLALQHLAFEDYATSLSATRRMEWRKIQGRFEDVPFAGGLGHAAALVGDSIKTHDLPASVVSAVQSASEDVIRVVPEAKAIFGSLGEAPAGYPLHPSALPAVVELTGRFGQHDRTLMAFLTSDAPEALPAFLQQRTLDGAVPFVRLPEVYDYFVEGAAALELSGEDASRLREIRATISEGTDLTALQRDCLKAIGVLNLVPRGSYRASKGLLDQALAGPESDPARLRELEIALVDLDGRGLITYRGFADEYRVWQGSDFDVTGAIAERREALAQGSILHGAPIDHLASVHPPRPVVARRHSQERQVLRYFESRYVTDASDSADCAPGADGLLLLMLSDDPAKAVVPTHTPTGLPVVALITRHVRELTDAVLDAVAVRDVLDATKELNDVVARRELRQRAALTQIALGERLAAAFDVSRAGVECRAGGRKAVLNNGRALSEELSAACDDVFSRTPIIRNEMLHRRELTSQGAKTRRELIGRLFTDSNLPRLGISGFGPDRAMYEAVLHASGLHREREGRWTLGAPHLDDGLHGAWEAINEAFDDAVDEALNVDDLYARLLAPPYGMKEGPIPLLLAVVLLARADDLFVFEDQTFLPRLGPQHFERLVKTPRRFSVKRASYVGLRTEVFAELRELSAVGGDLPPGVRNATTLAVVRPLIMLLQGLPAYAKQTSRVSLEAQRVRIALETTRDPDELLFTALPQACGVAADAAYVPVLQSALDELTAAYDVLLRKLASTLRTAFGARGDAGSVSILREELRSRSRHLIEHVIDRRLRAFLLVAINAEFEDREWLEALATVLAQKPPNAWHDPDIAVFDASAQELARAFRRVELLHLQTATGDDSGFEALRMTVTRPDGTEASQVLWIEPEKSAALEILADEFLARASTVVGSGAEQGLLAAVATKVLTDTVGTTGVRSPHQQPKEAPKAS